MAHSHLNAKRIAVVIPVAGDKKLVVRGVGRIEEDDDGNVLHVTTPSDNGNPAEDSAIIVKLEPKPPTIREGGKHGCDFTVELD